MFFFWRKLRLKRLTIYTIFWRLSVHTSAITYFIGHTLKPETTETETDAVYFFKLQVLIYLLTILLISVVPFRSLCFVVSGFSTYLLHCCMKEMFYEVRCLKSNEDMILALAGQFKQFSHEP